MYDDKFRDFITAFRGGKLTDKDNDGDIVMGFKKKGMTTEDKVALAGAATGALWGGVGAVVGSMTARVGYRIGNRLVSDIQRGISYDKGPDKTLAQRLNARNPIAKRLAEAELRQLKRNGHDTSKIEEEAKRLKQGSGEENAILKFGKKALRLKSI